MKENDDAERGQAAQGKAGAPRRRPVSGGYARGEEQRQRIIRAALKVFGEEGYERASTRMIAKEAGIQPPALQYYFDSKEGLHRACAAFIIERVETMLSGAIGRAETALAEAPRQALPDALCDLLDALLDASLFSKAVPEWALFSARLQTEDSPAAEVIRAKVSNPLLDVGAGLIARIMDRPIDDEVRVRVSLILGQTSVFHTHRENTLRKIGWQDFDGPRRDLIKSALREHTLGALAAFMAKDGPHAR